MSGSVHKTQHGDRTVYHLRDETTGASASILPSYGFNLFDLRLPVAGEVRPIVSAEESWPENPGPPARSGFPILFPFAGRIRDARFMYRGTTYELLANKPPHAIHGFAYDVPWDVVDFQDGEAGATIQGRFQISRHAPESLKRWPSDAILEVRYTLQGRGLSMRAEVTNPSTGPLPWALGVHSYFRLPIGQADLFNGRIVIPANQYWVLSDSLPTGETRDVVGTDYDFRSGQTMKGLQADLALTGLARDAQGWGEADLIDDHLRERLTLRFDPAIRQMVVFTPAGRPGVVAVEPYTAMADPFHLEHLGVASGLQELAPGGSSSLEMFLSVEGAPSDFRNPASPAELG